MPLISPHTEENFLRQSGATLGARGRADTRVHKNGQFDSGQQKKFLCFLHGNQFLNAVQKPYFKDT
jgi:hypothetical protein